MLRKMLLAATIVMALAAVVVPTASATWTHNHASIQSNATETFTGEVNLLQSAATGQVKCTNVDLAITFTAGQTDGTIHKFTCPNPTPGAHVTGAIAAICGGQTTLHKMELTEHATATIVTSPAGTPAITIEKINLFLTFTNGAHQAECLKLHLTSGGNDDLVAKPNNPQTIATAALTGSLTAHGFGTVNVAGTLVPHKVNTYGIVAP